MLPHPIHRFCQLWLVVSLMPRMRLRREADLVRLLWSATKASGVDPSTTDLYWDISAEASHRWHLRPEASGRLSCFLGSHKQFSTLRGRTLLGAEHLLLQGYPRATCASADFFSQFSDRGARLLAGQGMRIPQAHR